MTDKQLYISIYNKLDETVTKLKDIRKSVKYGRKQITLEKINELIDELEYELTREVE